LTGTNSGVITRHLSLDNLNQAFDISPDVLHARFKENAPTLATLAATRALSDSQSQAREIDALLISTCTGYLCPGLTSYVSERLGLRPDILGLDLVGQGCAAALPNLRAAEALLASGRCRKVLSICVEICSAAFFFDNDPGVLISACLFGDGAGAAVLSNSPSARRRIEWKSCSSLLEPKDRELLRFEQKDGMLRNILTPRVPASAALMAGRLFEDMLNQAQLQPADIKAYLVHPGGREVLVALRERLGLHNGDLRWSEGILREFGNVSSSSIFFVLQAALADSARSGFWWLGSFGAGFSCHGAILEVEP
jgi:alkylresorcinol/alkylpyrone synthase